jgi:hypothetical protein
MAVKIILAIILLVIFMLPFIWHIMPKRFRSDYFKYYFPFCLLISFSIGGLFDFQKEEFSLLLFASYFDYPSLLPTLILSSCYCKVKYNSGFISRYYSTVKQNQDWSGYILFMSFVGVFITIISLNSTFITGYPSKYPHVISQISVYVTPTLIHIISVIPFHERN